MGCARNERKQRWSGEFEDYMRRPRVNQTSRSTLGEAPAPRRPTNSTRYNEKAQILKSTSQNCRFYCGNKTLKWRARIIQRLLIGIVSIHREDAEEVGAEDARRKKSQILNLKFEITHIFRCTPLSLCALCGERFGPRRMESSFKRSIILSQAARLCCPNKVGNSTICKSLILYSTSTGLSG